MSTHDPSILDERWEIRGELGAGGMGRVLLAADRLAPGVPDRADPDTVALKILEDDTLRGPFVAGFRLLRSLAHPAFVEARSLGLDAASGRLYMVMERCAGRPLVPGSVGGEASIVAIAAALLRALDHLHRRGWVHGDLAPQNLLVDEGGSEGLKILDLGASGRAGSGEGRTSGVLPYLAPERLEGAALAPTADLWSAGAILFGLVHGRHPFPGYPSRSDTTAGPDRSDLRVSRLDPWLDRLLAADPTDRPGSAAAALTALEEAADAPLPLVPPGQVAARIRRLPFVDVGDHLSLLENRLRTAADAGRPQALRIGGSKGAGRSRLMEELAHRLVAHGLPVIREQALTGDPPGGLLRRILRRLDPGARLDAPDGPMAVARALLAAARRADRAAVCLIDDLDAADAETARAVAYVIRAVERTPERAGRLLLVAVSDQAPDLRLEPWSAPSVEALLAAAFPGRRIGDRVAGPLARASRGLPALLAHLLPRLAEAGVLEVGPSSVQLCGSVEEVARHAPDDADAFERARLEALDGEAREEAALLAWARGPVPVALAAPAVNPLLAEGLAVRVLGADGPAVTLRTGPLAEAARELLGEAEASARWAERWAAVAEGDPDAEAEALHYGLRAGEPEALDRARRRVVELPPQAAARLVHAVIDDDWPADAAEATSLADAADRAGRLDLAGALLRRAAAAGEGRARATALCRLGALEARQARHAAAIEALEEALEAGGDQDDELRAELLSTLARSAVLTGRGEDAGRWSAEGLDRVPAHRGDLRGRLRYAAGLVRFYEGALDRAEELLQGALSDAREAGDGVEEGAAITALGLVAHRRGDLDEAAAHYRDALATGERSADDARVLTALQNLGVVLHERGSFAEALDTYEEALELAEALEQTGRVLQIVGNVAHLWRYLGELDRARTVLERGLALAREEDNRYMEGRLLLLMGEVALADEAWPRAEHLLGEAVAAAVETRSVAEEAEARIERARLYLETQAYASARAEAEEARTAARRAENRGSEVQAIALLAGAHGRSVHGDGAEAERLVQEALGDVDAITSPDGRWPVLLEACLDARRRDDPEEAARHAAEVRRILRTLEDAVPARHRPAFRALRERRRARVETALPANPSATSQAGPADDRWARLLEINKRLSAERKVRPLLEYIMDSAILLSGAERGFLLLGEEAGGDAMEVHIARNLDRENIKNRQLKISHGIARRVIDTGEPAVTVDAMADERYRDQLSVHDLRLRSVLCIPMVSRRGVLGAIYLDNRFQASAFGSQDIRIMEGLADQAAIALDTARLVEGMEATQTQLEDARREVEALNSRLETQLAERTRELEDTHRVVIRQQRQLEATHPYDRIIGESDAIRAVYAVMDRLLDNAMPVLVEGESGTGKELVARAIHYNGARKDRPFVTVNCGAIPANLLESELFGHVRGAFTGASHDKEGLFEAAHGGTLLLDELGELPLEMQVKLLRVLQSGEIKKVGSTRDRRVDVRIIAATNRRLADEVTAGRFREDLYYRLAVIPIRLPPLRERRDDIPLLVQHFLAENRDAKIGHITGVSRQAMTLLMGYHWPGNVRQLEMVLKNASLFADRETLEPADFQSFPDLTGAPRPGASATHLSGRSLADIEREAILQALRDNNGNKKRSAEQLGIDRRTLYNKLARYDITVEKELHVR